ncbi:hypothetical protein MY3296_002106 [Beauveria thailandica]
MSNLSRILVQCHDLNRRAPSTQDPATAAQSNKYMLHRNQPHIRSEQMPAPRGVQHMYRCNCTLCHKDGLHARAARVANPRLFARLSPRTIRRAGRCAMGGRRRMEVADGCNPALGYCYQDLSPNYGYLD